MLEIDVDIIRGRVFVNLKGDLNGDNINQFEREVNYLLYKQGMYYYILDFNDVKMIDNRVIDRLKRKIKEISLSYGKVVINGLLDCISGERKYDYVTM